MKRLATLLMLMGVLLIGGMSTDAYAAKKKAKARTTQSSSSSNYWNGDMPTATMILNYHGSDCGFASKGYRITDGEVADAWIKDGVCKIEYWAGTGGGECNITVYNTAKLNKLYNDLKIAVAKKRGYEVKKSGNVITVFF